jgi:regulator of protease activity HflC (stomatin/prohibitin superfamily)
VEASVNWWILLIPLAIAAFIALAAIKQVEEGNRLIVERMGRHQRICGPGKHFLLPFIDRGIKVDLNEALPGWQGMTGQEVETKLMRQRYGAG